MLQAIERDLAAHGLGGAGKAALASIVAGAAELRDDDRRENAEDDHDDQNFDQRESAA